MISGIYKHNYFSLFGFNDKTKQFGYYSSKNSELNNLIFISTQNNIHSSVTNNLLNKFILFKILAA